MMEYYNMWIKQYFDSLESMMPKMEVKKELFHPTLKTNDYIPFVDNGLDDVMKAWAKNK